MSASVKPTSSRQPTSMLSDSGSFLSSVSWSLEKRATMRPSGVVSKKAIGACITVASIALWMAEAAWSGREKEGG